MKLSTRLEVYGVVFVLLLTGVVLWLNYVHAVAKLAKERADTALFQGAG